MKYFIYSSEKIINKIFIIVNKLRTNQYYKNYIFFKIFSEGRLLDFNIVLVKNKLKKNLRKKFSEQFKGGNYTFNLKTNKIYINNFYYKYFRFIAKSLLNIFFIAFSLLSCKKAISDKFNILYVPATKYPNIKRRDIIKYLKKNNLLFRNNNQKIILQGANSLKDKYFQFYINPLLYLCLNFLSKKNRIFIIFEIIKNIFISISSCFNSKLFIFIYEDLNELAIYEKIKEENIIEEIFFYRTSAYYNLFMFKEHDTIKKNYIFDNTSDFYSYSVTSNNNLADIVDLKILGLIKMDKYFVVDSYCKNILRYYVNSKIEILKKSALQLSYKSTKNIGKNNICIFDINCKQNMPLLFTKNLPNKFFSNKFNFINIFDIKNIKNFVLTILETVNKINNEKKIKIKCFIKYKFSKSADRQVILKFYKKLEKKYIFFKILDSDLNLGSAYNSFKTVISYPYSSPSHFFNNFTKRKSIFFDTLGLLKKNYKNKNIFLVSDKMKLQILLKKIFT